MSTSRSTRPPRWLVVVALACAAPLAIAAPPRKHVIVDGNRTRAVHTIPLYDENLCLIRPDDRSSMPFSPKMTCGDCHNYDTISTGWHFNSSLGVTQPGRPGEPWVLVDDVSGTQLPLSYRGWPGTWLPQDAGMTQWEFAKEFGRHMPGGDFGEKDEDTPDPKARWDVSGKIEINCLACHNARSDQNQSEWAVQIGRENFRWAATGASALGIVLNMASRLPDSYDLVDGPNKDNTWAAVPEVKYDPARFDVKANVFFDVNRNPPNNRCFYCHSSVPRNVDVDKVWAWDGDVHLAAGLTCTDCHRNGLDHFIVRGYEGERDDPAYTTLTCRGCHLGDSAGNGFEFKGGRMMAPRPLHRGLPAVHLEKLTCTACHSGFLPGDKTERVRTARANRLGVHGRAQWDTEMPYIMAPVFVQPEGGKIEPREMMWPAFWGKLKAGEVTPLPLAMATPIANAIREADRLAKEEMERQKAEASAPPKEKKPESEPEQKPEQPAEPEEAPAGSAEAEPASPASQKAERPALIDVRDGSPPAPGCDILASDLPEEVPEIPETPPLSEQQIIKILAELAKSVTDGQPVYVCGGKLYRLAEDGRTLIASDHKAAQPYSWPFAHDVRPASQSLGARGCEDCHEEDANFFFGSVTAAAPTALAAPAVLHMYEMEKLDPTMLAALAAGVELRTPFLIGGAVVAAVLAIALIHYGFLGLEGFLRLLVATGIRKPSE